MSNTFLQFYRVDGVELLLGIFIIISTLSVPQSGRE